MKKTGRGLATQTSGLVRLPGMTRERPLSETALRLEPLVKRVQQGDRDARGQLIHHACDRLLALTRRMLQRHPSVSRWEQTDDVFQNAMIRLHRSLDTVSLVDVRHFINLATLQIRRELIDLGRKYGGPCGMGRHHHTDHRPSDEAGGTLRETSAEPCDLEQWTAFHEAVASLAEEDRELVDLLFYNGLSQEHAAEALCCSVRTVRRRWQEARLRLYGMMTNGS